MDPGERGNNAYRWGDRSRAGRSAGLLHCSRLRGRALSSFSTAARCAGECTARFVPLGKYWRNRPLVFSLLPRCHRECVSAKDIGTPVAALTRAWSAISLPRSQVSNLRRATGCALQCPGQRDAGDLRRVHEGQMHEQGEASAALDQRRDRGAVGPARDQVALPVSDRLAVQRLDRSVADWAASPWGAGGLWPTTVGAPVGSAAPTTRTQANSQIMPQRSLFGA